MADVLSLEVRLLSLLLIEIRSMRGKMTSHDKAALLQQAGLDVHQVAAILDTTPEVLWVAKRRSEKSRKVDAVDPSVPPRES